MNLHHNLLQLGRAGVLDREDNRRHLAAVRASAKAAKFGRRRAEEVDSGSAAHDMRVGDILEVVTD